MMKYLHKTFFIILLPILTGVLLDFSALPSNSYYLSFIAFIPLLIASDFALSSNKPLINFALQLLIAIVTFYFLGNYWVLQTAGLGFIIGIVIVLPFVFLVPLYVLFKKKGYKLSALYFIAAWLTIEFVQSKFQLGSPLYNLGNNLGANPKLIQWYEFTGTSGGTLWILIVNFLIYSIIKLFKSDKRKCLKQGGIALVVLIIPVIISIIIYANYKEKGTAKEMLVIHPSTDNYDVKYTINIYDLMDIYLDIMLPALTKNTEYAVLPETAITNTGWVKDFNRNLVFNHFYEHTDSFPKLKLITGAITYEEERNSEKIRNRKKSPALRYSEKYRTWYNTYNAALQLEKNRNVQIRAKDELVPFQEFAPYPGILPHLAPVGVNFIFCKRDNNRSVFKSADNAKTAAMVCYEVVFGKMFAKAARKGAQAFFVILNEGWYNEPKVSQQLLQLSVIRAVETRRNIAHSSNMGISAFVNQRGEVVDQLEGRTPGFLINSVKMNRKITFSARMGNYIEVLALLTIISLVIFRFLIKK